MRTRGRQKVIAMFPKHGVGAEIGVWRGRFSQQILDIAEPSELYLIDPWITRDDPVHQTSLYGEAKGADMDEVYKGVVERFAKEIARETVIVIREPSSTALAQFPDGHFDYIYIDGDHEYSAVKADCLLAAQKVKVGGLICGDDYAVGGWWGDGVVRGFNEFIGSAGANLIVKYIANRQIVLEKLG